MESQTDLAWAGESGATVSLLAQTLVGGPLMAAQRGCRQLVMNPQDQSVRPP